MNPSKHHVEAAARSSSPKPQASSLLPKPQASSLIGCCLFLLAAAPVFAATPVVTGFSPSQADNCGMLVGATVTGSNFLPGATVTLTRTHDPDIPGVNVDVQSSTTIVADFDLSGIPSGMRKVVVTNPDPDGSGTLNQALQVTWCPPVLTSCSLTRSYACGPRYCRLDGTNLASATGQHIAKLTKAGEPDIVGTFPGETFPAWLGCWDPVTGAVNCAIAYFDIAEGTAGGLWSVVWTREDGQTATLVDAVEVIAECPRGRAGDLYVCNMGMDNVLQFDGLTSEFVCVFAGNRWWGQDTELVGAGQLAWAPNGNLLVTTGEAGDWNAVIECDGNTGEFLGYVVPPPGYPPHLPEFPDVGPPLSPTFGGPAGDLYVQAYYDNGPDVLFFAKQHEPATWEFIQDSVQSGPPMEIPRNIRFASNGNLLITGTAQMTPIPTIREYQYDAASGEFQVLHEVLSLKDHDGVVETPDGLYYLVTNSRTIDQTVERYSVATLEYLGDFVPRPTCLDNPTPECWFETWYHPFDLAYGPDGRLFVSGRETPVPDGPWPGYTRLGAIHVFDPVTGEQVDVLGQMDNGDMSDPVDPAKLWYPHGVKFKPMSGDYTSAGGAFGGDWVVDLGDYKKLAENMLGPGLRPSNPHALLSFDQDRDGDIDLKDYAAFQRAFGTSLGN